MFRRRQLQIPCLVYHLFSRSPCACLARRGERKYPSLALVAILHGGGFVVRSSSNIECLTREKRLIFLSPPAKAGKTKRASGPHCSSPHRNKNCCHFCAQRNLVVHIHTHAPIWAFSPSATLTARNNPPERDMGGSLPLKQLENM